MSGGQPSNARTWRQAFIDESVIDPGEGDGAYFIAAAIVIESPERLRALVLETLSRQRPFHWMDDRGPVVRERFVSLVIREQINVVVAYELLDGLGGQEPARRRLLDGRVLPHLHQREVGHIVFEQRGGQDQHDKRTMADFRAESPIPVRWSYEWASKAEPLLWIADAVAGAAMEHIVGRSSRWWSMLAETGAARFLGNENAPSSQA